MGKLEAQAVSINPNKPNETTHRPDGSRLITKWEVIDPQLQVRRLSHAALAEADHVIVAMEEAVPVFDAQAGENEGVTRLGRFNEAVGAAHIDRGGAGYDMMVMDFMGADKRRGRSRANSIKARNADERDGIATLLAIKGRATGEEMYDEVSRVREEKRYGRRIRATVVHINAEGEQESMQTETREKAGVVELPTAWSQPRVEEQKRKDEERLADIRKELAELEMAA